MSNCFANICVPFPFYLFLICVQNKRPYASSLNWKYPLSIDGGTKKLNKYMFVNVKSHVYSKTQMMVVVGGKCF